MASESRSYIVTGGSSGIGRATCLRLAQAGHNITIGDMDDEGGHSLLEVLRKAGGCAQFIHTDISNEESVAALVVSAIEVFGPLNGAVNCAGIPQQGSPIYELEAAAWDRGIDVNLRGMFLSVKHQGAAMMQTGGGAIVCVSSAAASKGLINSAEYCASKAGVTGLVRAAAVDYAKLGVRVNALLPGATDTPLAKKSQEANPQIVGTLSVPLGRVAKPEEVAASAVWLLDDESSYMTGASVAIDGGMSIA